MLLRFDVEAAGETCVVKAQEARFGLVSASAAAETKKVWSLLLDQGLKPYAEKG